MGDILLKASQHVELYSYAAFSPTTDKVAVAWDQEGDRGLLSSSGSLLLQYLPRGTGVVANLDALFFGKIPPEEQLFHIENHELNCPNHRLLAIYTNNQDKHCGMQKILEKAGYQEICSTTNPSSGNKIHLMYKDLKRTIRYPARYTVATFYAKTPVFCGISYCCGAFVVTDFQELERRFAAGSTKMYIFVNHRASGEEATTLAKTYAKTLHFIESDLCILT